MGGRFGRAVGLLLILGRLGGMWGWFGGALAQGVAGAELGDEVAAVFCCVHGEGCRDCEEGSGEGTDSQLFS